MEGETISIFDITLTKDISLKYMAVIGRVKIVALMVAQTSGNKYLRVCFIIFEFINFIFSLKNSSNFGSSKIIPKVELTESNKPISPPEKGLVRHINNMAKPKELRESAFFKRALPKRYIRHITLALITDVVKPAIPANNSTPTEEKIYVAFLENLRNRNNATNNLVITEI